MDLFASVCDLHRRWRSHPDISNLERARRVRSLLGDRLRAGYHLRSVETGIGTRVYGRPRIHNLGTFVLGDDCTFRASTAMIDIYVGPGAVLRMGSEVRLHSGDTISALDRVEIGDRVQIGPHVIIQDNSFHDLHDRNKVPDSQPVVIEDDVWLATRCMVLPGVRIGRGAVVAAQALVTRDVDPFTVVGGVPAVPISKLDPKEFSYSPWSVSRD